MKSMRRVVPVFTLALAAVSLALSPGRANAAPLPGAIFTTDSTCTGVNLNIYSDKAAVYIDGGPAHPGAAGLPTGDYYVQVTEPNGNVLGKSNTAVVHVGIDNEFSACYQLSAILTTASSGFTTAGYDDTTNPGGEYKVWVSTVSTFDNDSTKTDNFKVKASVPCTGTLNVIKFYDANANGLNDDGIPITGWKVSIEDDISLIRYTPVSVIVEPDTYLVTEFMPLETSWRSTTPTSVCVTIACCGCRTVEFGNLCLGAGGGLTLGFWSNKNGQALILCDDLAMLVGLNLRNADGSNFDPGTNSAFRTWILSASATNMANMLSAQLAAMELSVFNGKVKGSSIIYAPGTTSANTLGYTTVAAVMAEANTELGLHGLTLSGSPYRSYQEALKNALDRANNNMTFVQPCPCPFTFE